MEVIYLYQERESRNLSPLLIGNHVAFFSRELNKNALLFMWSHSGVAGTSITSKNALAKPTKVVF